MESKTNKVKFLFDVLYMLVGCIMVAFSVTVILKPNHLITGGITGFSLILESVTGISYTIYYYIFSLLILITTHLTLGKKETAKIIMVSIVLPSFIVLFNHLFSGKFNFTSGDMFLSSIYYGVIGGIGTGILLKRGFSTGGSDTVSKIVHIKLFPFISISQIVFFIDFVVIVLSIIIFDLRIALYAIITQMVMMKSLEVALYGFGNNLLKLEILSPNHAEIEQYILKEIGRGVTRYTIVGAYSNEEKTKLITVCSKRESMLIRQKLAGMDERVFVTVSTIASVWGDGQGFDRLTQDNN